MPAWFLILLTSAGALLAGYLIARYALKRANLKPSYKGLLVGLVAGVAVFLLARILKVYEIDLFRGTAQVVFQGVLILAFLAVSASMFVLRMRSGPELADLGAPPLRGMFLGLGVLLLIIGIGGRIAGALSSGQTAVNLAQGILFLALGLARTQIRERGIYHSGALLPWNRIARYQWSEGCTLTLALRRPRWWQDRVQLPVPPVLVERVDELMRLHVPPGGQR
jgi:hypothetical protein